MTATNSGSAATGALDAPPAPPVRAVTPAARARSWVEPGVRLWWLTALALLACGLYFVIAAVIQRQRVARLLREGTPVQAVIFAHGGAQVANWSLPIGTKYNFKFQWNGEERVLVGFMPREAGQVITGQPVTIYVDPNDVERWTSYAAPPLLLREMSGGIALGAVAAVAALVAFVQRRRVLGVWERGEAARAVVVEARSTAMAPRSRHLRCAREDGQDKRLISVVVPLSRGALRPGDPLWIVMPPHRPDRAIAAALYE